MASDTTSKKKKKTSCSVLEAAAVFNYVTEPTTITSHSAAELDLFATNPDQQPLALGRAMADISNHLLMFLIVNKEPETKIKRGSLARRVRGITPEALPRLRKNLCGKPGTAC